jgi:hypothetical protein
MTPDNLQGDTNEFQVPKKERSYAVWTFYKVIS